ncbi:hypothetical protein B0T18DRAFT_50638 [Schizothecium vesticola]|uniref:Uncharacterized protein n=1 Tax=Schizothecium vesticola TaxID=314040 RepID=A0AA40FC05_9PEZI|nr:hypothetical protein B0T18DRAFT_50638 [Schizothecium vesticola]
MQTESCRTTHRARADTSAASVAARTPPTCLREGGVPVTPAAPGALADWIDWLQFPLGRSWHCWTFSAPLLGPLPLLDQATLSRFTSSSPSLFCFTSTHSLLSIFPSRLPLKERDLNRQPHPLPNDHHNTHRSIPPRLPPRQSSEAAKASITPSLATDDQGKRFLYFRICRGGGSRRLGLLHHYNSSRSSRVATGPVSESIPKTFENGSFQSDGDFMTGSQSNNPSLSLAENKPGRARQERCPKDER